MKKGKDMKNTLGTLVSFILIIILSQSEPLAAGSTPGYNSQKNAYFGDLHVHTRFSFDAFIFKTRATPDDAYRYAKGQPLMHPAGYQIRLQGPPLDFLAVTDHGEYIGIVEKLADPSHELSKLPIGEKVRDTKAQSIMVVFREIGRGLYFGRPNRDLNNQDVMRSAWQQIIESANRHYQPGKFTSLIGYEFTSSPGYTLHRNVIFRGDKTPDLPFSSLMSQDPEDLWDWLDEQREQGILALAIPHNSNISNGNTFNPAFMTWSGDPYDKLYAERRMRNEPLVEITQVKGTSDTHPTLSPNDEWADFEIYLKKGSPEISGSYVREAYLAGLTLAETRGFNPYQFGLIGSSDTHNAAAGYTESNYFSKIGVVDGTDVRRGSIPKYGKKTWGYFSSDPAFVQWGASGLAGVWAEENTRDAIFNALQRKETFATSGPRIRVRFFAGYYFEPPQLKNADLIAKAYQKGVPMGGKLQAEGKKKPGFLVWAMRDPNGGRLQRLQIIKGWVDKNKAYENVFDIACSDGLIPAPETHRCPDNRAKVNLSDCSVSTDKGANEIRTLWKDPTFIPGQRAIYYVRVLENPSCRWSTWDAVRAKVPPNPNLKKTIQDRAWSSPIWYVP